MSVETSMGGGREVWVEEVLLFVSCWRLFGRGVEAVCGGPESNGAKVSLGN